MITVATLLWDANAKSLPYSRHYTEADVEKLYRSFARHLSVPFRFVCFSEKPRSYAEPIEQERLTDPTPGYGSCIEPYRLNEPMILVGLDTIVVGNINHLAAYCIGADKIAVPMDPFHPQKGVCNGVALVPSGHARMWSEFPGGNDMDWMRRQDVNVLDEIFPGQVVSFKRHVLRQGLSDEMRIVYFHGEKKPAEMLHINWIAQHWLGEAEAAA